MRIRLVSNRIFAVLLLFISLPFLVLSGDPTQLISWNFSYRNITILGNKPKQIIAINGQFPGPEIHTVTNENLVINVFNHLDEPLLITWNGIWQRRTSWQDGVIGTNCPIPVGGNFTYNFQVKDQIGTYFYFPSTSLHKSAGGYGGFKIDSRSVIPLPYPVPDGEAFLLVGDWYTADHKKLRVRLNAGLGLGDTPDGVLINGKPPFGTTLTFQQGKTYRLRIANVGMSTTLNVRIEGHKMKVVETEGSHTQQMEFGDLDVHVGQSYSVLVTLNQAPGDYYIVASTRFSNKSTLSGVAILHYANAPAGSRSRPLPPPPAGGIDYALSQAMSIRWNLTANAARPNPQGSFHYGTINVSRTVMAQGAAVSDTKGRRIYAVNGVSYVQGDTPLKLADYFGISGVFTAGSLPDIPSGVPGAVRTVSSVLAADAHAFLELIFENTENVVNPWHVDGYSFFVVGMGTGTWTPSQRSQYNLIDAISRSTVQVYPNSWTAVLFELDNVGMWNIRSQLWDHTFLGQQFYMRVFNPEISIRNEAPIPSNVLLCGKAKAHRRR